MGKASIAINEPTSSGRSVVVKVLTKRSNYVYRGTSAMYRTIMYLALQNQVDIQVEEPLVAPRVNHTIPFQQAEDGQRVFIDGHEVTEAIRQPDVTNTVSTVSKHVRAGEEMMALRQKIGQTGGVIMDGRDAGTTVLPRAEVKIFLVASIEEHAERHFKESREKGIEAGFETLKTEIEHQDYLDLTREVSSLVQAGDTAKIDTTGLTIEEVIVTIQNVIKQKGFKLF